MFNQTKLNPLEELLFQSWARAHRVDDQNDPNNSFDYRGVYKQSNGTILPSGVLNHMSMSHNAREEGGDTVNPDPYMAQAEMHGNMLKDQADQRKLQMEERKLQHQAEENEKDRQHKLQLETMKLQQKAQADEANRQARSQEAQAMREARSQEAQAARNQSAQEAQLNRQEAQVDREADTQSAVMQEHFTRTRPQPQDPGSDWDNSKPLIQQLVSRQVQ